jgi:hypothetical protein
MVLILEAGERYLIVSSLYIDNNLYFCVFAQFEFMKKRQFPRMDEHHQFQLIIWPGIFSLRSILIVHQIKFKMMVRQKDQLKITHNINNIPMGEG